MVHRKECLGIWKEAREQKKVAFRSLQSPSLFLWPLTQATGMGLAAVLASVKALDGHSPIENLRQKFLPAFMAYWNCKETIHMNVHDQQMGN